MGVTSHSRVAVVTGASRRAGIGYAIAQALLADEYRILLHSWARHDECQPWGADPGGIEAVIESLGGLGPRLKHVERDFEQADAPRQVISTAVAEYGTVDVVVANHAHSAAGSLSTVTVDQLDRAWAINARASVLLAQAYAGQPHPPLEHGRIILFTSGQHLAPMADELPYAISKGAVHQMTASLADALIDRGITVNAINPGPVDTGWPTHEQRELLSHAFPGGRWGRPRDIADVVRWLASGSSAWITGQVINAEGGFRRSAITRGADASDR